MYDVEINAACGNLDLQTKSIYTTSCHDRMYRHGYICQYNGKPYMQINILLFGCILYSNRIGAETVT